MNTFVGTFFHVFAGLSQNFIQIPEINRIFVIGYSPIPGESFIEPTGIERRGIVVDSPWRTKRAGFGSMAFIPLLVGIEGN
ncbi:MAG: hypothetical protein ACP5Q4_02025 [Candidatus Caldatribacteriaceae bacterium]